MIALARSEPGMPIEPQQLDASRWLFNCLSGTVDLRRGVLRPHHREDLLTTTAPVGFNRKAQCPLWQAFLDHIMDGDGELVDFLQRSVGYSLTGDVSEDVLFFLYGRGANGKTTFLRTVMELLGDYGRQANASLLLTKRREEHPTEIANLFGARLVACVEVEEDRRLAENLVKWLTGGDKLTARRMREDYWQFEPTHKIWLAANSKPRIHGQDHAIWRRIRLIPFQTTIPEEEQDKHLFEKLRAELPGILNWAVKGCLAWQEQGLGIPNAVRDATDDYREEEDLWGAFVADCCIVAERARVKPADMYNAYRNWCQGHGEHPISQQAFARQLTARNFSRDSSGLHWRRGIGLKGQLEMLDESDNRSTPSGAVGEHA